MDTTARLADSAKLTLIAYRVGSETGRAVIEITSQNFAYSGKLVEEK